MRNDDLLSIFDHASFHDHEPVPGNVTSAVMLLKTTFRLFLKAGFTRQQFRTFTLLSDDISTGVVRLRMPKPFDQKDRDFYERFLNGLQAARDELNGLNNQHVFLGGGGDPEDEDEYNDISVMHTPDYYYISANFSELTAGLMNYLSFFTNEDMEPYEDDYDFDKTRCRVQQCFNLAYGYKPH